MTVMYQKPNKIAFSNQEEAFPVREAKAKIFLGGSIEMGKAFDWQTHLYDYINSNFSKPSEKVWIFNPRRDDWNPEWLQDPLNGSQFNHQVTWEIEKQNESNLLIYNFEPGTISPITLLELGLYLKSPVKKMVICPKEFGRYGNVALTSYLEGVNVSFFTSRNEYFFESLNFEIQRILNV